MKKISESIFKGNTDIQMNIWASGSHGGQLRRRTLPSLQKILLENVAPESQLQPPLSLSFGIWVPILGQYLNPPPARWVNQAELSNYLSLPFSFTE